MVSGIWKGPLRDCVRWPQGKAWLRRLTKFWNQWSCRPGWRYQIAFRSFESHERWLIRPFKGILTFPKRPNDIKRSCCSVWPRSSLLRLPADLPKVQGEKPGLRARWTFEAQAASSDKNKKISQANQPSNQTPNTKQPNQRTKANTCEKLIFLETARPKRSDMMEPPSQHWTNAPESTNRFRMVFICFFASTFCLAVETIEGKAWKVPESSYKSSWTEKAKLARCLSWVSKKESPEVLKSKQKNARGSYHLGEGSEQLWWVGCSDKVAHLLITIDCLPWLIAIGAMPTNLRVLLELGTHIHLLKGRTVLSCNEQDSQSKH